LRTNKIKKIFKRCVFHHCGFEGMINPIIVGFEVLMVVSMNMAVFWVVAPPSSG
jgi:hypothetical protein